MSLRLHSGEWEAELRPEIGGSLSALRWRGNDILRPMPAGATNPLDGSCFPIVPYCNRLRDGRFAWQGREVQLPLNFLPQQHSLHGLGWQQVWQVDSAADFKCALEQACEGSGAWPWAYSAEQRIRLGPKGCAVSLTVTNRADVPAPMGLGLHPYFRRQAETRVRFESSGMIEVDAGQIPNGDIVPPGRFADWQAGARLPCKTVDHCFAGWDGGVTIEDDLGSITMTARGAPFLHLYAPADGSALCCEPVSHAPDALNREPAGMIALPPGCSATLQMWIAAGPGPSSNFA